VIIQITIAFQSSLSVKFTYSGSYNYYLLSAIVIAAIAIMINCIIAPTRKAKTTHDAINKIKNNGNHKGNVATNNKNNIKLIIFFS
tara:strand:- start:199 stop:456 length:258 start_codon:yes stop_codon:yes gene_type:complete